jgi:hypothetical protein
MLVVWDGGAGQRAGCSRELVIDAAPLGLVMARVGGRPWKITGDRWKVRVASPVCGRGQTGWSTERACPTWMTQVTREGGGMRPRARRWCGLFLRRAGEVTSQRSVHVRKEARVASPV